MRWKERPAKVKPSDGDKRTERGFIPFPIKLQGEWRWLEMANVVQEYVVGTYSSYWKNVSWAPDPPKAPKGPAYTQMQPVSLSVQIKEQRERYINGPIQLWSNIPEHHADSVRNRKIKPIPPKSIIQEY